MPRIELLVAALAALLVAVTATPRAAAAPVPAEDQIVRREPLPKRLERIDVDEQLDARIPLDLAFRDEDGNPVLLGELVDGSGPVILTLNYSNCPMLCSLQLDGFVKALRNVEHTAGAGFRIVTVSLDPKETPATATRTKHKYLRAYGRPGAEAGWRFLTGSEANIQALANAIGFRYGFNEKRQEYVHPAVITLLTPDGRVGRYLYGIDYPPRTLELSLVEVGAGKIGSSVDRLLLYCFHYDEQEGHYAPVARNLMKLGGAAAMLLLGGLLTFLWIGELYRRKRVPV